MPLQIKSFNDIMVGMASWIADKSNRLIDFTEGSVIRMLLEAVATELEEYYFKTYQNIIYAMDNAVYDAFGFEKEKATHAKGKINIQLATIPTQDSMIGAGTVFTTGNNLEETVFFVTTSDYIIPAGMDAFSIEVMCTEAGEKGNVIANTITNMQSPIAGIKSINNPFSFTSGENEETSAERRARFTKYVASRSRGTKTALEYGTMEVDGVSGCYVEDMIGAVNIYAHDSYGYLPENLKQEIIKNLEEYRCAGLPLYVYAPTRTVLNIALYVYVDSAYNTEELKDEIEAQVKYFLDNSKLGEDILLSDLNSLIRDYDPIAIKNCRFATTEDIVISEKEIIRAGTIQIYLINYGDNVVQTNAGNNVIVETVYSEDLIALLSEKADREHMHTIDDIDNAEYMNDVEDLWDNE